MKKQIATVNPNEVKLISYKMTATIKTGDYQNIIPEILVEGGTIDEAETILMQHIDMLREKYGPAKAKSNPVVLAPLPTIVAPVAPTESESFKKAAQAIKTAYSPEAITLIRTQIQASKKLDDEEKSQLKILSLEKEMEINEKATTA